MSKFGDTWQTNYYGYSIITRDVVGEIKDIYERMPCVLRPEAYRK